MQGAHGGHGADHLALILQGWLTRFATFEYGEENRGVLLPFFSAVACCAVAAHPQVSLPSLKEALELLAGRSLDPGEIAMGARLALRTNRFDRIPEDMKRTALEAAGAIEAEQTQSQRLVSLIEQVTNPATKSVPKVPPRYQRAIEALWQHRKSTRSAFGVVARSTGPMACPCCYGPLHAEDASRLRADQVCLCMNCRRPRVLRPRYGRLGPERTGWPLQEVLKPMSQHLRQALLHRPAHRQLRTRPATGHERGGGVALSLGVSGHQQRRGLYPRVLRHLLDGAPD